VPAARRWVALLVAVIVIPAAAQVQLEVPPALNAQAGPEAAPLTLRHAVEIALEKNPLRKAALAEQKAAAADARQARSSLLPQVTFSETATRGNDPVYAFGTRLRQGRFTSADFALNRLNSPTPIGNFATRFGGQWNLFDSFSNWANIQRANAMRQAAGQQLAHTDQETVFQVINAYYGLLLAQKQLQLAQGTVQTADAILSNSKARYDSGLVVESDYLSSVVNAATRRQELIRATNAVLLARAQLSNALGITTGPTYAPAEALTERTLPQFPLEQAEKAAIENRPDLKQIELQEVAQSQGVRSARAAFGPRVNAFASWGLENPTLFAGGGGNNWMGGIEVQLDLFSGRAKAARLAHEKAMQERIAALRQATVNNVSLDVRRAWYDADTARQQLEVARTSITQSEEALRISQNRYGAGLTTITELLRSEDAARRSRTDYWQSIYNYHTAYASLQLATGTLSAQSPVVSQ
jgi:outer membrane protein